MDRGLDHWESFVDMKDGNIKVLVIYLCWRVGPIGSWIQIPLIALKRIKVACYEARYTAMIGKEVT